MTEEQKKALINRCKNRIAFYKAAGNTGTFDADTLQLTEIALAALTAPPVKLPRIEVCDLYATPYQKGLEAGATQLREEFIRNIRAAGYQVEGE